MSDFEQGGLEKIAVIGMSGRFPGANSVDQFWENLCQQVESVTIFDQEQLERSSIDPEIYQRPNYVGANGIVKDVDMFDADYFAYSKREAEVTDPQHRILLECSDEALIQAGYSGSDYEGNIGVFVGCASSSYFHNNVSSHPEIVEAIGQLQANISSEKSFVATKISYKLGLTGPSMTIDTACSTSLVAIHQACSNLLSYESDIALAGGAAIDTPQVVGHMYQEGGIASPDGHCRTFDALAKGTVRGNGAGVVVLKRYEEALEDGDTIHAVVLASAVNNDGKLKAGFTAASVDGQRDVISAAHSMAEINADSIGYIEAHGTGTELGDPVEIQALTQAFSQSSGQLSHCAIGSLKTNIGHLDIAAGVAGFIKTVLVLKHGKIPASLHFKQPNPKIDFAKTPFYVADKLLDWPEQDGPKRAGVSSFGIGGSNAHILLESFEEEQVTASNPAQSQVLQFSAQSSDALEQLYVSHGLYFGENPSLSLADAAFTLRNGRQHHQYRGVIVAKDAGDAARKLADPACQVSGQSSQTKPRVAFMFAGQGGQKINMMLALYRQHPTFNQELKKCAAYIQQTAGWDLLSLIYPAVDNAEAQKKLDLTQFTQPALFCVEYALAKLLNSWGIQADLMIGHSLGEYVAATIAGVFSLQDAITLILGRAELMQELPAGDMLAVSLGEHQLQGYLQPDVSLAGVNAPGACVLSGTREKIVALKIRFENECINCQKINTSHAFHSAMMDPALEKFKALLDTVQFNSPSLNFISNVSGKIITAAQATDPYYWVDHLRGTVRFAEGVATLSEYSDLVCLEVGPGHTLTSMAIRNGLPVERTLAMLSGRRLKLSEQTLLDIQVGRFWCLGGSVDWEQFSPVTANRIPLPSYPYQRKSFWLEPKGSKKRATKLKLTLKSVQWQELQRSDKRLKANEHCVVVNPGQSMASAMAMHCRSEQIDYSELQLALPVIQGGPLALSTAPDALLWFASMAADSQAVENELVALADTVKQLRQQFEMPTIRLVMVCPANLDQGKSELLKAAALVANAEFPEVTASALEIDVNQLGEVQSAVEIMAELASAEVESIVSISSQGRFIRQLSVIESISDQTNIKTRGCYLVTGGCGGIGQVLAKHLAKKYQAKLILLGRSVKESCQPVFDELLDAGATSVAYFQLDITDNKALAAVAEQVQIDGIIHAAGINADGSWMFKDEKTIHQVLAAKVSGMNNLNNCFNLSELNFVLMCSTVGVITGVPFQLDYVAANAYLDGFAKARQGQGNICSVNWGMWSQTPLSIQLAKEGGEEVRKNLKLGISNQQGIRAFEQAVNAGIPQVVAATDEQFEFLNGLLDGNSDSSQKNQVNSESSQFSRSEIEAGLRNVWQLLLGVEDVSADASFFELGGNSLLIVQQGKLIEQKFSIQLTAVDLFNCPTLNKLIDVIAKLVIGNAVQASVQETEKTVFGQTEQTSNDVAIIAMALRVSGARTTDEFWKLLKSGKDNIQSYSDETLINLGVSKETLANDNYIKSGYPFDLLDQFDADLFRFSPNEAALTDPQQRMLIECSHEALQVSGYENSEQDKVGIYAGTAMSGYLLHQILPQTNLGTQSMVDSLQIQTGNSQDYAATQTAFRLGSNGPAVNINSACSTSLVAVHIACQAILNDECDLALAGGASIRVPNSLGYQYAPGSVESPTGKCRPFDADADGTIMSSGVGIVALKRLSAALRDGDHIHGVIKGSAINNDGDHKVSFAAPSPVGQQEVISAALQKAEVDPGSISYIEAHGTGTKMGDPIELEALKRALKNDGDNCFIGSVKSNVGHLDSASGVVGLIKTALMLEHRELVPTANFNSHNPLLDISNSRFNIADKGMSWQTDSGVLRAGISSFGIGGSNAHVIVQAPPEKERASCDVSKRGQLLLVSGHNQKALELIAENLIKAVDSVDSQTFESIAYTLASKRKHHEYRQFVYVNQPQQIALKLHQVEFTARAKTGAIQPLLLLGSWQSLPLTMIADLTQSSIRFKHYFALFCEACDGLFPPLSDEQAQQEQPVLVGFAFHYALVKTLSEMVSFDYLVTDEQGQWLFQAITGETQLAVVVKDFLKEEPLAGKIFAYQAPPADLLVVGFAQPATGIACDIQFDIQRNGYEALLVLTGELWLKGCKLDCTAIYPAQAHNNVILPAYPYQRKSHWFGSLQGLRTTGNTASVEPVTKIRPAEILEEYVEPANDLELRVTEIWQDILGISSLGTNDDFFTLGGHSLMATQMISKVKQVFDVEISIETLFQLLTPAKMADHIFLLQTQDLDTELLAQLLAQPENNLEY